MRVVISQPMKGLTEDQIRKNRAEAVTMLESEGHAVINTVFSNSAPAGVNQSLWLLGKSFQAIASVDAVYFMDGWREARGCRLEYEACKAYGITILNMNQSHLGEVISKTIGSVYSPATLEGIAQTHSISKIKNAILEVFLDEKGEICQKPICCAKITILATPFML